MSFRPCGRWHAREAMPLAFAGCPDSRHFFMAMVCTLVASVAIYIL